MISGSITSPISVMDSADVFEAMMADSGSTSASCPSTARFTAIFSGTASMTMSTSANW